MLNKASGSTTKDSTEVKVDYKLFPVGSAQSAKISGTAKGSNGGFGVGSGRSSRVCRSESSTMMTGGMGMGMMNPMMGMAGGMGRRRPLLRSARHGDVVGFSGLGGSGMAGMGGMAGMPERAPTRLTPTCATPCQKRRQRRQGDDGSDQQAGEEVEPGMTGTRQV